MKTAHTTMVCFRANGSAYCLPLDFAASVRTSAELVLLPDPAPEVAGIIAANPPLTVISPFGSTGGHVIVVETAQHAFGLLVDEVTGLRDVDPAGIGPAPAGQARVLVSGTVESDGELVFVTDPDAMAARL